MSRSAAFLRRVCRRRGSARSLLLQHASSPVWAEFVAQDENLPVKCDCPAHRRSLGEMIASAGAVLFIGEHDKGLGRPFPGSTLSGRRLRKLIGHTGVRCVLVNMEPPIGIENSLDYAKGLQELALQARAVVFLGRRVEERLRLDFSRGIYLPHPASRRSRDGSSLAAGIKVLARPQQSRRLR